MSAKRRIRVKENVIKGAKSILERLGRGTSGKQPFSRDLRNVSELASKPGRNSHQLASASWCSVLELRSCQY